MKTYRAKSPLQLTPDLGEVVLSKDHLALLSERGCVVKGKGGAVTLTQTVDLKRGATFSVAEVPKSLIGKVEEVTKAA